MYVNDNNNDIKHDSYYLLRPPCQTVQEGSYSSIPFWRRGNRGEVTSVQETVKIKAGVCLPPQIAILSLASRAFSRNKEEQMAIKIP